MHQSMLDSATKCVGKDDSRLLQPWTKYLKCEIVHCGIALISIFKQFFASINKIVLLGKRKGTRL